MGGGDMTTQVELSIAAQGATDDEIASMTRELATWIGDAAPGCGIIPSTKPGPKGSKGILEVLGSVGVSFLEPGALTALINCLSVFIKERRREVNITLKTASGASVELKAGGVGPKEVDDMISQLGKMIVSETKGSI
jgi:hypothetical protein